MEEWLNGEQQLLLDLHSAITIGNASLIRVGTPGKCMQFFVTGPALDKAR
jgi:hypothetical protein